MALANFNCQLRNLDFATRRNVFRFLRDDHVSAASLVLTYPELTQEIGTSIFAVYRARRPSSLHKFLAALVMVSTLSPFVDKLYLHAVLDGSDQGGLFEWMMWLIEVDLLSAHDFYNAMSCAKEFAAYCESRGVTVKEFLQGWQNWYPGEYLEPLFEILPIVCPDVEEITVPWQWGEKAEEEAWTEFPNLLQVNVA